MKKKTAILLAGTMIASTILAGCGSKEEGAANQVASEELKGDITFWHSFTQGPRLEVIQETADQFMKDNPGVILKLKHSLGEIFTQNGQRGWLQEMCQT